MLVYLRDRISEKTLLFALYTHTVTERERERERERHVPQTKPEKHYFHARAMMAYKANGISGP